MACRNYENTREQIDKIKGIKPTASVDFVHLDLESLQSVKNCANEVLIKYSRLDCLICNAGIFGAGFALTEDNYERTFQVNHLAQFYLILLLKPLLMATPFSKIVILSSESHRGSLLDAENISEDYLSPKTARNFLAFLAYNDTKLCNCVIATEIHKRWSREKVSCNSVHPGNLISTGLSRHWWFYRVLFSLVRPFTKSLQQGATTTVWAATAEELVGVSGQYLNNCWLCTPSVKVHDDQLGQRLWSLSVAMIEKVVGHIPGISGNTNDLKDIPVY